MNNPLHPQTYGRYIMRFNRASPNSIANKALIHQIRTVLISLSYSFCRKAPNNNIPPFTTQNAKIAGKYFQKLIHRSGVKVLRNDHADLNSRLYISLAHIAIAYIYKKPAPTSRMVFPKRFQSYLLFSSVNASP